MDWSTWKESPESDSGKFTSITPAPSTICGKICNIAQQACGGAWGAYLGGGDGQQEWRNRPTPWIRDVNMDEENAPSGILSLGGVGEIDGDRVFPGWGNRNMVDVALPETKPERRISGELLPETIEYW